MNDEEVKKRIDDLTLERENMDIDTSDDTLKNIMTNNKNLNINDIFEYFKYKSTNNDTQLSTNMLGTVDTLPGYEKNYASFLDDNEYFSNSMYTDIQQNNPLTGANDFNIDDFQKWNTSKPVENKLSKEEIDSFINKRRQEEEDIFKSVENSMSDKVKRKEVEKFLDKKYLNEEFENIKSKKPIKKSVDNAIDEMLAFMDD